MSTATLSAISAENSSPVEARCKPGPKPRAPAERRTWSVKDVAEFLGVSERTIWRWYDAKKMPKAKKLPGRTVRWTADAITKWFERQPTA